jgi:tetratricopeptide (TPR) repeat protein
VGREAELEELAGAWTAAAARRPSLLLVAGEAGIGKTRLIQEAAELARATGGLVAWTRCYQAERSLFLQPLTEAVRTAVLALPPARLGVAAGDGAGTLAELVPEVRRLLDPPPYQRAPAELERRRFFEAVTGFFRGLAAQQPVLLVVDDLHQAGTSTLELLHFLARRLDRDRLLLATVRAEEAAEALAALADVARVLELGPLPPAAVAELARRLGVAGLAVPVLERTRGHTLFAEARRVLDEAVEECRAAGMFRPMLTACFAAALASGNLGDLAGALARLATMERLLAHVEDPLLHARAATTGSWLWRELGDLGRARELAERAVELTGPAATSHPALHAQLALAECLLQAGGRAEAAALLELAGGRLQRPFAYRWRVELRHAELASRLEPAAAERLLALAGTYGSAKYRALALARLGRNREALQIAAPVGSDYLLAQVAGGPLARAALDRMAAALPPELRPAFMDRGRLAATLAGR